MRDMGFKNVESENIMYEIIYEFKNIFKKLKLFKIIFEAEMPLFFLIKYRKNKEKRECELPNSNFIQYPIYITFILYNKKNINANIIYKQYKNN